MGAARHGEGRPHAEGLFCLCLHQLQQAWLSGFPAPADQEGGEELLQVGSPGAGRKYAGARADTARLRTATLTRRSAASPRGPPGGPTALSVPSGGLGAPPRGPRSPRQRTLLVLHRRSPRSRRVGVAGRGGRRQLSPTTRPPPLTEGRGDGGGLGLASEPLGSSRPPAPRVTFVALPLLHRESPSC